MLSKEISCTEHMIHIPLASCVGEVKQRNSQKHLYFIMFWTNRHSQASGIPVCSQQSSVPGISYQSRESSSTSLAVAEIRTSCLVHYN